jgi:hypothetical protein
MPDWLPALLVGWALGIAGTLVTQGLQSIREQATLKESLAFELQELRHRLIAVVYWVADSTGALDRPTLSWMLPIVKKYRGVNPSAGLVSGMEGLLKRSDAELAALNAATGTNLVRTSRGPFHRLRLPSLSKRRAVSQMTNCEPVVSIFSFNSNR